MNAIAMKKDEYLEQGKKQIEEQRKLRDRNMAKRLAAER